MYWEKDLNLQVRGKPISEYKRDVKVWIFVDYKIHWTLEHLSEISSYSG